MESQTPELPPPTYKKHGQLSRVTLFAEEDLWNEAAVRAAIAAAVLKERQAVPTREFLMEVVGLTDRPDLQLQASAMLASSPPAPTERQAVPEVTDAMVDAYLKANDAYWHRTDALPTPPDKWRTGTPREATRESLVAALASSPPAPAQPDPTDPGHDVEVLREHVRHLERRIRQLAPAQSEVAEPVAKWENAEGWESLAWELCADEHGEEACTELIWEGGTVPEPWGDRWLKYEGEAKRLIALVQKHVPPPQPSPVADEREAFEAWVLTVGLPNHGEADWAWGAWQARAALASQSTAQVEPLTDEQIDAAWDAFWAPHAMTSLTTADCRRGFARAIEAAHHIGRKA